MMSRASTQIMAMVSRAFLSVSFCWKGWTMQRNLWEDRWWWLWAPGGTSLGEEGSQDLGVGMEGEVGCSLHVAFGGRDRLGCLQLWCFQRHVGKDALLECPMDSSVVLLESCDKLLTFPGAFPQWRPHRTPGPAGCGLVPTSPHSHADIPLHSDGHQRENGGGDGHALHQAAHFAHGVVKGPTCEGTRQRL